MAGVGLPFEDFNHRIIILGCSNRHAMDAPLKGHFPLCHVHILEVFFHPVLYGNWKRWSDDQTVFPWHWKEDKVFQASTARRPLLTCLQRKHSVAYRAASSHSASVRVAGLSQNWCHDCARAPFPTISFRPDFLRWKWRDSERRNSGERDKTLLICALRSANVQIMCQAAPVLTQTTDERRSTDGENKGTKFTTLCKVAETDATELDSKPLCVYCD